MVGMRSCLDRRDEAWPISGHGGMRIVRRFEAEINLRKIGGGHWEESLVVIKRREGPGNLTQVRHCAHELLCLAAIFGRSLPCIDRGGPWRGRSLGG
jgi:hypothetical protein